MSTRAVFTVTDENNTFHIYKHYDGYPSEVPSNIAKALKFAWQLPRFEADEFAAAFVTGNKCSGGSIRLLPTGEWQNVVPQDISFLYVITCGNG